MDGVFETQWFSAADRDMAFSRLASSSTSTWAKAAIAALAALLSVVSCSPLGPSNQKAGFASPGGRSADLHGPKLGPVLQENRLLGVIPGDCDVRLVVFRDDGREAAYSAHRKGGKEFVVVCGAADRQAGFASAFQEAVRASKLALPVAKVESPLPESSEYDKIWFLRYKPHSEDFIVVAREAERWRVIEAGRTELVCEDIGHPVFCEATGAVAYAAEIAGKFFVVVDGKRGPASKLALPEFDEIGWPGPLFAHATGRVAYKARRGNDWFLVIDSEEHGPFDEVWGISFSRDGRRLAFTARRGKEWFVSEEGRQSGPYDGVGNLVFSENGNTLGFVAQKDHDWFVVIEWRKTKRWDGVWELALSRDGSRAAYFCRRGPQPFLVLEELARPACWTEHALTSPGMGLTFSPDAEKLAYVAQENAGERVLVLSGVEGVAGSDWQSQLAGQGEIFQGVGMLQWSPDSSRLAYRAIHEDKWSIVMDGRRGAASKLASPAFDEVGAVVFSGDGKHSAYTGRRGQKFVLVVDGQEVDERDKIIVPRFLPEGAGLVYGVRDRGKEWVVFGERSSEPFDWVWNLRLSPDGKSATFGAQQGRDLWWRVLR